MDITIKIIVTRTESTHLFYMLKDHPSQDEDKQEAKLICQTIKLELD
jgi:hypothetical protein